MNLLSRRSAIGAIALGSAPALLDSQARSQDPKPQEPPLETKRRSEIDARMDLVIARFGDHLDEAGRDAVRREIDSMIRRAAVLRAFPLENDNAPMPVFRPFRAPVEGS
jgi:hypothetical protein